VSVKPPSCQEMNCRERVLRAIRFEHPDKIPLSYSVIAPELFRCGQRFIDLCKKYPNDFYDIDSVIKMPKRDTTNYRPDGSYYKEWTDEWGSVWVYFREEISGEVKRRFLMTGPNLRPSRCRPYPTLHAKIGND